MPDALRGVTGRGWCLAAAGVACLVCAWLFGEPDLLRVGLLLVVLPPLAAVTAARVRLRLRSRRRVTPVRLSPGRAATVTVQVENTGKLPTSALLLEDRLPPALGGDTRFVVGRLPAGGVREVAYRITAGRRGRHQVGPLSLRLTDPFGLAAVERTFTPGVDVVVLPRTERLDGQPGGAGPAGGLQDGRLRSTATSGEDDAGTRAYRRGDDLRRVHWRTTARVGELMVRREEQPRRTGALLLLDGRATAHGGGEDAESFEWAVCAVASCALHLARAGHALRLVREGGTDVLRLRAGAASRGTTRAGADQGAPATAVLDTLAVVGLSPPAGPSPGGAVPLAPGRADGRDALVVAALGRLTAADLESLGPLRPARAPGLAFVLDVDAWDDVLGAGDHPADGAVPADAAVERLRAAGWTATVVRPGDRVAACWSRLTGRPVRSAVPR